MKSKIYQIYEWKKRNGPACKGCKSWVVMILLLVSIFTRSAILDILAIGLINTYVFSRFLRNINKRYAENQKFLNARYEWTVKAERRKKRFARRKQ